MANTITNLVPSAYRALNVVSREMVGFIPSVQLDPSADELAQGQTIYIPQAPANSAGKDIAPAMAFPAAAYQTIGNKSHALSKARAFPFSWTGEEKKNLDAGPGYLSIQEQQIAQAIRAAVNEMEVDISTAAKNGASRAYGTTAGTAPALADFSGAQRILDDNLAPMSDRAAVINTAAAEALRNTSNLYKVNESGDSNLLRQGLMGDLYGFALRQSSQIQTPTAGTLSGASTASGALTVGQTVLTMKTTTGTGNVVAGDIITLANDTNKYVVVSTDQAGANPGTGETITIAAPGIMKAQGAAERTITVFASAARNIAFNRSAILLSTRVPAIAEGDLTTFREIITDPVSGISLEIRQVPGDRMVHYEIGLCWGVTVLRPDHVAVIIG